LDERIRFRPDPEFFGRDAYQHLVFEPPEQLLPIEQGHPVPGVVDGAGLADQMQSPVPDEEIPGIADSPPPPVFRHPGVEALERGHIGLTTEIGDDDRFRRRGLRHGRSPDANDHDGDDGGGYPPRGSY